MEIQLDKSWMDVISSELEKEYFLHLSNFIDQEYQTALVFPPKEQLFSAFSHCSFNDIKVVIIGQDPYHGFGQANGLCFSVSDSIKMPPSLVNIFKEIKSDIGKEIPISGNLENWAKQGVLLLNTTLSVRESMPGSHQKKGWEQFTDKIIELISIKKNNIVFLLWGSFAHKKEILINAQKHCILKAAHPSPLSSHRGFGGCKHFSLTNDYLIKKGLQPINW